MTTFCVMVALRRTLPTTPSNCLPDTRNIYQKQNAAKCVSCQLCPTIRPPTNLLADIRQIFAQSGANRLSCKQLVTALQVLERPSSQAPNIEPPVTARWLG